MGLNILNTAADRLLESHEFTLQCAPESGLVHVDFRKEHKGWLAERITAILTEQGLGLDMNVPRVRVMIFKAAPSEVSYEGLPCIDLDAKVFIFTTEGPKHFTWRFGILKGNSQFLEEIDQVVDEKGGPALSEPVNHLQPDLLERLIAGVRKLLKLPNNRS